ncbi:MAG: hypothetical protein GTN76_01475 [Candidatus Aenigmarchaeota archaeon]|nr:hypothetical protein [Candidatus Aenigmarchaeota archaeon]
MIFLTARPAEAGISLGKGGITLSAGETTEMCDIWIYATQEGGTYHVSTTGDLEPLTAEVTPNDFTLDPIDCPQETQARRACITQTCLSDDSSSCKVVCIKFTAPTLIEWNPEKVIYSGGILNSIKIGAATINEPYTFSVHVNPMDIKPIVTGVVVVIIIIVILLVVFLKKRKR